MLQRFVGCSLAFLALQGYLALANLVGIHLVPFNAFGKALMWSPVVGAVGALAWAYWARGRDDALVFWAVRALIRAFLALVIAYYGFGKVFPVQFANYRYWAFDNSGLDMVGFTKAWVFFGHSRAYQMFLGWSEVVGGLLLLFSRTEICGACLLATIMVNVAITNFAFHIGVEKESSTYAAMALYLLWFHRARVTQFFFTLGPVEPVTLRSPLIPGKPAIRVAYLLFVLLFGSLGARSDLKSLGPASPIQGTWSLADPVQTYTRFYFSYKGEGAARNYNEKYSYFHYDVTRDSLTVEGKNPKRPIHFQGHYQRSDSGLVLKGELNGQLVEVSLAPVLAP